LPKTGEADLEGFFNFWTTTYYLQYFVTTWLCASGFLTLKSPNA